MEYLKRFHDVSIRVRRAQLLLDELGYGLKQPLYWYVQASQKGVKKYRAELKKKLQTLQNGTRKLVVLFEDEAGFSPHPKPGRMWCERGTAYQPVVFTRSQYQQRLNVFG